MHTRKQLNNAPQSPALPLNRQKQLHTYANMFSYIQYNIRAKEKTV